MQFTSGSQSFNIKRYPPTENRSLMPWSAAERYMLDYWAEHGGGSVAIWHDRFGFLGTTLHAANPVSVLSFASQQIALERNLTANKLEISEEAYYHPLDTLPPVHMGLMRIPKSLDLFGLYLHQAAKALDQDGTLLAGFMTRHFSPQLLERAAMYFEEVEQSRAWKKARLLILKQPKSDLPSIPLADIKLDDSLTLKQYPGVFSSTQVDPATRLLLEHMQVEETHQRVLDLGCGNGVIAAALHQRFPDRTYHLMDDAWLAIASAKLNMPKEGTQYHYTDNLKDFPAESFDLVVSNPPFHLGYENNIEVSLSLFEEVSRVLAKGGSFQLVANRHLNYGTHLERLFPRVKLILDSKRFHVYACRR